MQNNPHKQDIIQELRGKRQDVTELCTEAEAVNEPHIGSGIVTDCLYLNVRKLPDINADVLMFLGCRLGRVTVIAPTVHSSVVEMSVRSLPRSITVLRWMSHL